MEDNVADATDLPFGFAGAGFALLVVFFFVLTLKIPQFTDFSPRTIRFSGVQRCGNLSNDFKYATKIFVKNRGTA